MKNRAAAVGWSLITLLIAGLMVVFYALGYNDGSHHGAHHPNATWVLAVIAVSLSLVVLIVSLWALAGLGDKQA